MKYFASTRFWKCYDALPEEIRALADKTHDLLTQNPGHPTIDFKKLGKFWVGRVGTHHRALAIEVDEGLLWAWIGTHEDYDRLT